MKLNDFKSGSNSSSSDTLRSRLGRNSQISFVNETKETEYQSTIDELTKKAVQLDKVNAELATAKVQRQEALQVKEKLQHALDALTPRYKRLKASYKEYEEREPQIKQIITQHRELNGQVAELQGKLQLVIEEHDKKVDVINLKIEEVDKLKDSLHQTEILNTKAQQAKIEAVMERDVTQTNLDEKIKKLDDLSIIYQESKEKLSEARHERNVFEALKNNAEEERDKALTIANRSQSLVEKMEKKSNASTSTSTHLQKENESLIEEVSTLSKDFKDLTEEYILVLRQNAEMLAELKKPRFASVASISKNEGFKFPASFESRNNTLGTGKPTLLRKKE